VVLPAIRPPAPLLPGFYHHAIREMLFGAAAVFRPFRISYFAHQPWLNPLNFLWDFWLFFRLATMPSSPFSLARSNRYKTCSFAALVSFYSLADLQEFSEALEPMTHDTLPEVRSGWTGSRGITAALPLLVRARLLQGSQSQQVWTIDNRSPPSGFCQILHAALTAHRNRSPRTAAAII
jgi:hypothetical protein